MQKAIAFALILFSVTAWFANLTLGIDFVRMEQIASQRYGPQTALAVRDWHAALNLAGNTTPEKLRAVNEFFNHQIRYESDQTIWEQSDYWATPLEMLWKGSADCEDFAIAKYFSLKALGIAPANLRLIYVKAHTAAPSRERFQAHMVLAYYATPTAEPLILDNLISDIRPASRRPDLVPIFSFNSEGMWHDDGAGSNSHASDSSRLSRWQDLLFRMKNDGYE